MAITIDDIPGVEAATNGTTPADVVASPGAGERHVIPAGAVGVVNADDVVHDIVWQKLKGATVTVLQSDANVVVGGQSILRKKVSLDATDEKLQIVLGEAHNAAASRVDGLYLVITVS